MTLELSILLSVVITNATIVFAVIRYTKPAKESSLLSKDIIELLPMIAELFYSKSKNETAPVGDENNSQASAPKEETDAKSENSQKPNE